MWESSTALVNHTAGLSGKCVRRPSSYLYYVWRLPKYLWPDLQGVEKTWWTSESHLGVEKIRDTCSEEDCVTIFIMSVRDGEGIIYTLWRRKLGTKPGAHKPHVQVVFTEFMHAHILAENKESWQWKPSYYFLIEFISDDSYPPQRCSHATREKQSTSGKCMGCSSSYLYCL